MAEWTNDDAAWARAAVREMWLRCVRHLVAEHQRIAFELRAWLS